MKFTPEELRKMGIEPSKMKKTRAQVLGNQAAKDHEERLFDAMCLAHHLPLPEREVEFAKSIGRDWRFDYLFDGWLAVERDGGVYGRGKACPTCGRRAVGAHSSISQMRKDREKDRAAMLLCYSVVRFIPEEFSDGSAFKVIKDLLGSRG